jgi:hypothetical protein
LKGIRSLKGQLRTKLKNPKIKDHCEGDVKNQGIQMKTVKCEIEEIPKKWVQLGTKLKNLKQ